MAAADYGRAPPCRSADAAAPDQIDDPEQHDRADEGPEQADRAEGIEAGDHAEKTAEEIAEERADDADDDVQEDALLRVGAHDDVRQPADDAADDQCDDQTKDFPFPEPAGHAPAAGDSRNARSCPAIASAIRGQDRKSVGEGQSGAVSEGHGGRRYN